MKLTKKQIETLPDIYETDGDEPKKAYIHFFNILGRGDWYVLEGKQMNDGDWYFFGYVRSPIGEEFDEYGYFTLQQLKDAVFIELDKYFEPTLLKEVI